MLHISIEVADLERSIDFYISVLDCSLGRRRSDFADVWFFGCQLTLVRNERVNLRSSRPGPHFGAIVDDHTFRKLSSQAEADIRATLISPVESARVGTVLEQKKVMFGDPDGNRIELKTYADVDHALRDVVEPSALSSVPDSIGVERT